MIGGNGHEAGAKNGVGAGGVNLDLAGEIRALKPALCALRFADPVLLHQPHLLGPAVEVREALQQFLGKIGDFQEPLAKLALLHQRARAPAAPVNHLLVGQHGHVDRIPIDRRFLAIDQIVGIKVEEQRLLVAVIVRLAGGDLAAPVQRETEALQLRLHVGDVLARPAAGVHALFHGGVFGRHAKGVPAHWVQHLKALHRLIAGQHVTHRIVADMADVDAPRRIGKHLQHIGAGLGAGIIGAEALGLVPRALPAPVGHGRIETFTHTTTCLALNWLGLPEPPAGTGLVLEFNAEWRRGADRAPW